jgi:hypothetical protein
MQPKQSRVNARQSNKRIIRWATEPYRGRLGEYVGVALDHEGLKVGIRTSVSPRWVAAIEALTPAEAEAWARAGFRRRNHRT